MSKVNNWIGGEYGETEILKLAHLGLMINYV